MKKSISIDYEKCCRDGICSNVCPRNLIAFSEKEPKPTPTPEFTAQCIGCGHCMAVCPSGAISINGSNADDCNTIDIANWPTHNRLDHLLRSRRSIRVYKNKPVERHLIEKIMDICSYAPSGSNAQPVKWIITSGKDRLKELGGLAIEWMKGAIDSHHPLSEKLPLKSVVNGWELGEDHIFRQAPLVSLNYATKIGSLPLESCIIAMTYMEIAAASLGLGTCWNGLLLVAAAEHPPLKEALKIPHGDQLFGAMTIGYPKYTYQRIPPRNRAQIKWR